MKGHVHVDRQRRGTPDTVATDALAQRGTHLLGVEILGATVCRRVGRVPRSGHVKAAQELRIDSP